MKKKNIIGSILTILLFLTMPLITAMPTQKINVTPEIVKPETQEDCEECTFRNYCEGLANFTETLREARDEAKRNNRMIVYFILVIAVKWNSIKYLVFCEK